MPSSIRDTVQDCNLNFLIGSGLSSPYLKTLGPIESLLTLLEQSELAEGEKTIIRCSLYKSYFDGVMLKNCDILQDHASAEPYLKAYCDFVKNINLILQKRKSTILGKEANIFTTNIDIFIEKAIERAGIECNDGFSGRFEPWFSISNFKKSHFRRSLQYDNVSELPTINLLKLHGSLTWRVKDEGILFSSDLNHVRAIGAKVVNPDVLLPVDQNVTFEALVRGCQGKAPDATVAEFLVAYDELPIVNPTKAKFRHTMMNQTHYEMLRIYSNELEKENTVLFVLGFSFADEHIHEITLRSASSNPTLMIYLVAYDSQSAASLEARFPAIDTPNRNVKIMKPSLDDRRQDTFKYDLATMNRRLSKFFEASATGAAPDGGAGNA
jgi:SIR2-like domain